jgi:hypothetical protein
MDPGRRIEEMLDHLHREDAVERTVWEGQLFEVGSNELGRAALLCDGCRRGLEDPLGYVAPDEASWSIG